MAALAVAGFGQDIGDEMFVVGCWDVGVLCCQDFDGMFFFLSVSPLIKHVLT